MNKEHLIELLNDINLIIDRHEAKHKYTYEQIKMLLDNIRSKIIDQE